MFHRTHRTIRAVSLLSITILIMAVIFAAVPVRAQESDPLALTQTLGRGAVRSVEWSPDGEMIAVGGALGLWLYTPELQDIARLQGHTKAVYDIAFSPDSARIATVSHDMTVRTWDVRAFEPLLVMEGHENLVVAIDWHPTAPLIVSGAYDGTLRLWNADTGEPGLVLRGHDGWISDVMFSPDGAQIASTGYDGTLRIWDTASGDPVAVLEGHVGAVLALDWHNEWSLVTAGQDGSLRGWSPSAWAQSWVIENAHDDPIYDVDWSPQGFTIASAGWDGMVRNWTVRGQQMVGSHDNHTGRVHRVVWNPLGTQIATLGWDDTVRLWDVTQSDQSVARHDHMDFIVWLGWDEDGLQAITLDGRRLVWDTGSGALVSVMQNVGTDDLPEPDATSNGKKVTLDAGGIVQIWDADADLSGEALMTLPGRANAAVWSPDGTQLAVAVRNGTITLWTEE